MNHALLTKEGIAMFKSVLLFSAAALAFSQNSFAANKCAQLFQPARPAATPAKPATAQPTRLTESRLTRAVKQFQSGQQDTTSLRQEVKYVVKTSELTGFTRRLEEVFGERFKNRDKPAEGFANITSTNYMTVGKFIQNGKKLAAKVRFRKYFSRALEDTAWRNLEVAPGLADRSWLEIKIQHPEFDNVVYKPRLQILDKDIPKLITEATYFDYREGILRRLNEINPGKEAEVQKFADYFDALFSSASEKVENMFARTEYERTSYSIKLQSGEKQIDVQITLDQDIRLTRLRDGRKFDAYGKDETVVEVKIPLEYAKLDAAALEKFPELAEIKEFIAQLDSSHVPSYPKNKGKMSKIDPKGDLQTDRDYDTWN
jgi:hypothetical protein